MIDLSDELRIIATETGRLSAADRATIAQAANDLEYMIRHSIMLGQQLLEANARRVALTDQLAAKQRDSAAPAPSNPWSMSTGWVRVAVVSP